MLSLFLQNVLRRLMLKSSQPSNHQRSAADLETQGPWPCLGLVCMPNLSVGQSSWATWGGLCSTSPSGMFPYGSSSSFIAR